MVFVGRLMEIKRNFQNAIRVAETFGETEKKKDLLIINLFLKVDKTHCINLGNAVTIIGNHIQTRFRQHGQASLQENYLMMDQWAERTLLANQSEGINREEIHSNAKKCRFNLQTDRYPKSIYHVKDS